MADGVLVGRHDFTSFRATACQARSPVKTLDARDRAAGGPTAPAAGLYLLEVHY